MPNMKDVVVDPFKNTSIGFLELNDLEANPDTSDEKNKHLVTISKNNPDTLYLLMVYADWCGPCKMTKPAYAQLSRFLDSERINKIRLLAINTTGELDTEKNWSQVAKEKLGVTGYPTILVVCGGKVVDRHRYSRDLTGFLKTIVAHGDKHPHTEQIVSKIPTSVPSSSPSQPPTHAPSQPPTQAPSQPPKTTPTPPPRK